LSESGHAVVVPYDPTIYDGAAEHYRRGRPPYSADLESFLAHEIPLDGTGRLLDVGCGAGALAVRLAPLFDEAVGLDPDAAMLREARRVAEDRGVKNVRWVEAVGEDLPTAAPGPYRLVTFGQSFQWTDQARVARTVRDLLDPSGALALIVHAVEGRPKPPSPGPPPIPHDEINALIDKYLGATRRAGRGLRRSPSLSFSDVLGDAGFGSVQTFFLPGVADLVRDAESVLAGYFSFSFAAPHLFGDGVGEFAADLRELLASRSSDGRFWDWPGDTEVVLARPPGSEAAEG
jgi:SAM-dependent methyltransferase